MVEEETRVRCLQAKDCPQRPMLEEAGETLLRSLQREPGPVHTLIDLTLPGAAVRQLVSVLGMGGSESPAPGGTCPEPLSFAVRLTDALLLT